MVLGLFSFAACHRHGTPEEKAQWITSRIAGKLDLTDEQKTKLSAVTSSVLDARKEFHGAREAAYDELLKQVTAPELDRGKILKLVDERRAAMDKALPTILDKVIAFHKSLSDKQKQKVADFMKEWRGHDAH